MAISSHLQLDQDNDGQKDNHDDGGKNNASKDNFVELLTFCFATLEAFADGEDIVNPHRDDE